MPSSIGAYMLSLIQRTGRSNPKVRPAAITWRNSERSPADQMRRGSHFRGAMAHSRPLSPIGRSAEVDGHVRWASDQGTSTAASAKRTREVGRSSSIPLARCWLRRQTSSHGSSEQQMMSRPSGRAITCLLSGIPLRDRRTGFPPCAPYRMPTVSRTSRPASCRRARTTPPAAPLNPARARLDTVNGRGDLPMVPSPPHQMQVLSIVHSAAFGGPHNQAVQLHRALERSGIARLTVVMPDEPGDAPDRLRASGVSVVQMPLLRPRAPRDRQGLVALLAGYPGQILRLRRLVRTLGIDVVEVHGLLNLDGAVAGRLAGRGVVWQLIDTRPPPILRWLVMPLVLLLADVIMTTGSAVADEYPGTHLRPRRLIPFVPPVGPTVTGTHDLDEELRCTRQRLSVPEAALLIASVGNLNPPEGLRATHRRGGRLPCSPQ